MALGSHPGSIGSGCGCLAFGGLHTGAIASEETIDADAIRGGGAARDRSQIRFVTPADRNVNTESLPNFPKRESVSVAVNGNLHLNERLFVTIGCVSLPVAFRDL